MEKEKKALEVLPPGEGFAFNYQSSRLDRNALFALNRVFDPNKISQVRTKYKRAILNIDDLRSDLMEYNSPRVTRTHSDSYYSILESVDRDIFGHLTEKIIPLTHGAVAKHPNLPKSKSPGLPLKQMGYATKGDALADPNVLNEIRKTWYAIERNEDVSLPDVACYARAQICAREKNKVRATWGYPLSVYLTEGQYFYPMLEKLKTAPQPKIAYGIEIGNGGMQYINSMLLAHKGSNYIIGDWSRFDKAIPAWLIRDAFMLVESHIDFSQVMDVEGKLWPVRPSKSKKRWRRLIKYFIDTPIQMSSGERFIKHGGIPSGSCWTNVIDSVVNAIKVRYIVYELTGSLPEDDEYLGDDFIVVTKKPVNLDALADFAKEAFGSTLNVDKSYQTNNPINVHFLGYYNIHGHPFKPVDTTIASSVYPERPTRSKFETVIRLVGQAYSCFDPDDAKRFFLAAEILRKECDGLSHEMMESFIAEHAHFFKYLQTLGIDVRKGIKVPQVTNHDIVLITQPHAPRRKWVQSTHDLEKYAIIAYNRWQSE